MKILAKKIISLVAFLGVATAHAQDLAFKDVLNKVLKNSQAVQATDLAKEASQESLKGSQMHWLPQLYVDAKYYSTNDPGANFFGLLSQRKVEQADFNPADLNHPGENAFFRGALGVNWMLYEGGMKSNEVELKKSLMIQTELEQNKVLNEIYLQVFKSYALVAISQEAQVKYQKYLAQLDKQIKSYQLGQKSNPVGYSGLLGMQALRKRIEALLNQEVMQEKSSKEALAKMGLSESLNWKAQVATPVKFITEQTQENLKTQSQQSNEALIWQSQAQTAQLASDMQLARFRPRVGLFAEDYLFNGDRDTSDGYTVGVYLQWSLYNPGDYSVRREAVLKAQAAQKMQQAQTQKDEAETSALKEVVKTLNDNYQILNQTIGIMDEQISVSENLFRNGSMNTLQFVEVLSRRVDLQVNQNDLLSKLIDVQAQLQNKYSFKVN